jgi:hypothetical protein
LPTLGRPTMAMRPDMAEIMADSAERKKLFVGSLLRGQPGTEWADVQKVPSHFSFPP